MKQVSYSFIFSVQKSLRSSIILLLIKYPNKVNFKVLFGSRVKAMAAAHSTLDLRNASQKKQVLGNEQVVPRPFLIHHLMQERLANSQIHSFKEISIWKVAKGKKNCSLGIFVTSDLN